VGEDPEREGLRDTPSRVARAYLEMLSGYHQDPADLFRTFEAESYDSMVVVRDLGFRTLCEHHALPFYGVAHVAYIPNGRIIGLSKIARLVDLFSRRLQVQERLTVQIADTMVQYLDPMGVAVVLEGEHLCMASRGVRKEGSTTITSAVRGVFLDPAKGARDEFLRLIGK
jgi:GTP cyclohydrolase I